MKEAEASALEEYVSPSEFSNHGERVVVGQRLMTATSDMFLGWLHIDSGLDGNPRAFCGPQLRDWKGSAEIEQWPEGDGRVRVTSHKRPPVGQWCSWVARTPRAWASGADPTDAVDALPRGVCDGGYTPTDASSPSGIQVRLLR